MYSASPRSTHLAGFAASHSSGGGVAAAVVIGLFLLSMAIPVMLLIRPWPSDHGDGRDGDSGSEGGGGGSGGRGPRDPGPPLDEHLWWPEFERQFADYVTSTTRTYAGGSNALTGS